MRKRIFIVAAVTVIGLTGCASVPTLSEDQNNAMAEYIADNLLMHDKSYSNSIKLNSETETATPQPSVQPTVAPTPKVSVTPAEIQNSKTPSDAAQTIEEPKQTYVSMSDALQVPGFKVKFDGYKFNSNISTKDSNISNSFVPLSNKIPVSISVPPLYVWSFQTLYMIILFEAEPPYLYL